MLPRWHIIFGAIFTAIIWIFSPETKIIYLSLVFLSSVLIDFDHYLITLTNTNHVSIIGPITELTATKFINDIQPITDPEIYIYIKSPNILWKNKVG